MVGTLSTESSPWSSGKFSVFVGRGVETGSHYAVLSSLESLCRQGQPLLPLLELKTCTTLLSRFSIILPHTGPWCVSFIDRYITCDQWQTTCVVGPQISWGWNRNQQWKKRPEKGKHRRKRIPNKGPSRCFWRLNKLCAELSRTPHQEVLLPERNVHSAFSATNKPGEESGEQNKTKHPGWFWRGCLKPQCHSLSSQEGTVLCALLQLTFQRGVMWSWKKVLWMILTRGLKAGLGQHSMCACGGWGWSQILEKKI